MIDKVVFLMVTLVVFLVLRFPVYFSLVLSSVAFALCFPEIMPIEIVAQGIKSGLSSTTLAGIAFFFWAGEIMSAGGISEKIIEFCRSIVGHVRGGLSHVNVLDSVIFAGISGSAMADTAATSVIIVPAMKKNGYPGDYAIALTLATSCIGPIIPPSTGIVLVAIYCGANAAHVLMAGLVPGLLMGAAMLAISVIICTKRGYPKDEWRGFGYIIDTLKKTILAILMPVLVIYCLSSGIGSITEVGAATCVYCIIVSVLIYKNMTWKDLFDSMVSSGKMVGRVLCINAACGVFNWIVASLGMRQMLVELMTPMLGHPVLLMFIVLAIFLVGGCFMAQHVMLYVITPLMAPMVVAAGYDLTAYCVFAMIACTLGLITPPVGTLIYMGATISKEPPTKIIRQLLPFIFAIIVCLVLLIFFPQIASFLPNMLYG